MGLRFPVAATAAMLMLLAPAPASAKDCESLPGRSALDQYCQAIPDGGGGKSAETRKKPDRTVSDTASPKTTRALEAAGGEGQALLNLPAADPVKREVAKKTEKAKPKPKAKKKRQAPSAKPAATATAAPALPEVVRGTQTAAVQGGARLDGLLLAGLAALSVLLLGGVALARRSRIAGEAPRDTADPS